MESPQDAVNNLTRAVHQQRALRAQSSRVAVRARAAQALAQI
jgi:hypothetical protein